MISSIRRQFFMTGIYLITVMMFLIMVLKCSKSMLQSTFLNLWQSSSSMFILILGKILINYNQASLTLNFLRGYLGFSAERGIIKSRSSEFLRLIEEYIISPWPHTHPQPQTIVSVSKFEISRHRNHYSSLKEHCCNLKILKHGDLDSLWSFESPCL